MLRIVGVFMDLNCAGFMVNETFFSRGTGDATRMGLTVSLFSIYAYSVLRMEFCVKFT